MEDRLLKFCRLVDAGSFTRAASILHISQPALSAAMQKLARELGTELIRRDSQGLHLTPAGQVAYTAAQEQRLRSQNLRQRVQEAAGQAVHVRLGLIDSLAESLLAHPTVFGDLRSAAQVALTIDNSSRLLQAIQHDECDVACIVAPARGSTRLPANLTVTPIGNEPLLAVAKATSVAVRRGVLPNFLSYNASSTTHQLIMDTLMAAGYRPEPSFYSTSPAILLQLALQGQGIAVLPYHLVAPLLESHELVVITDLPMVQRQIIAIQRQGKHRGSALEQLCQALGDILETACQATATFQVTLHQVSYTETSND